MLGGPRGLCNPLRCDLCHSHDHPVVLPHTPHILVVRLALQRQGTPKTTVTKKTVDLDGILSAVSALCCHLHRFCSLCPHVPSDNDGCRRRCLVSWKIAPIPFYPSAVQVGASFRNVDVVRGNDVQSISGPWSQYTLGPDSQLRSSWSVITTAVLLYTVFWVSCQRCSIGS